MVRNDPKLPDDGGETPHISRNRVVVHFPPISILDNLRLSFVSNSYMDHNRVDAWLSGPILVHNLYKLKSIPLKFFVHTCQIVV